ncbi:MAG: GDSL-type esterase/lipase family protein [Candidatus Omnitrophota bacterium]
MRKIEIKHKIIFLLAGVILAFGLLELILGICGSFCAKYQLPQYNLNQLEKNKSYIVCLGASFTFGLGTDGENSYPRQLEKILNERVGQDRFRVLNLGVPGYNSTQVAIRLSDLFKEFCPDIVVVLTGENDSWSYHDVVWTRMPLKLKAHAVLAKLKSFRLFSVFFENLKRLYLNSNDDSGFAQVLIKRTDIHRVPGGNYKKVIAGYLQLLEKSPENKEVLLELGRYYKLSGEYEQAGQIFTRLFRLNPQDDVIYEEINDLLIRQDNIYKSIEFYRALFDEFPGNQYVREQLCKSYIHSAGFFLLTGQSVQAVECYKKVLEINPGDKRAFSGLNMARQFLQKEANSKFDEMLFNVLGRDELVCDPYIYRKIILLANLNKIIKMCEEKKCTLIFSGYPLGISPVIREAALSGGIPVAEHWPVFNGLLRDNPYNKYFVSESDGHCTKEGYRVMAENIAALILYK